MTGKSDGTVQTFDALNRMTRYQNGSSYVTYAYYPDDMRKGKKVGIFVIILFGIPWFYKLQKAVTCHPPKNLPQKLMFFTMVIVSLEV